MSFFGVLELPAGMEGVPSWLGSCDRVVVWVLTEEFEGRREMSHSFRAVFSFIEAGREPGEIAAETVLDTPEHLTAPKRQAVAFESEIHEPFREPCRRDAAEEPCDGRTETQKLIDAFKACAIGARKADAAITEEFERVSTMPVMDDAAGVVFQGPVSTCQQTVLASLDNFRVQVPYLNPGIVRSDAPMALFTARLPRDKPDGLRVRGRGGWDCC